VVRSSNAFWNKPVKKNLSLCSVRCNAGATHGGTGGALLNGAEFQACEREGAGALRVACLAASTSAAVMLMPRLTATPTTTHAMAGLDCIPAAAAAASGSGVN